MTVHDAVSAALGEEVTPDTSEEQLRRLCAQAGVPAEPGWNRGQVVLEMYERLVEGRPCRRPSTATSRSRSRR